MPKDGCSAPFSAAGESRAGQPHNSLHERARLQSNDRHRKAVPEKRFNQRRAPADTDGVPELVADVREHVGEHLGARAGPARPGSSAAPASFSWTTLVVGTGATALKSVPDSPAYDAKDTQNATAAVWRRSWWCPSWGAKF